MMHITHENDTRFNTLMKETYKKVFNMAYRLSGNRSDAEDLTQEAFYRAYRSFPDYQGDRPFENWIFRILSRLFLDMLRSRKRRVQAVSLDAPLGMSLGEDSIQLELPDRTPNPEERLMDSAIGERLSAVLATLSPEQRMLVTLADVEGLPYSEIAIMLGKPVGTIRSRLHRTRLLIRKRLQEIEAADAPASPMSLDLRPCGA